MRKMHKSMMCLEHLKLELKTLVCVERMACLVLQLFFQSKSGLCHYVRTVLSAFTPSRSVILTFICHRV
jgi:hypothetical protein